MSDNNRNNLHLVEPDAEEAERRERARRRIQRIVIIVAAVVIAAIVVYVLMVHNKEYSDYNVTSETERSDTSATHYLDYGDGYVKYSNDGASYVTVNDVTMWNQSYEMENPMVAVCEPYIAFVDRQGETVYVLDEQGLQGEISLIMPAYRIDIASQGTVAVLTMDSDTGYLSLFDKSGGQIAEGAIHVENSGTPLDIALSSDGKNLAVAIVDVSSGTARTTINFYNFSTAGQNQIDNLLGEFQYADTIIPDIEYAGDSTLVAFSDKGIYVFDGGSSPKESGRLEEEDEIQEIFYDDSYFGLVFSAAAKDGGREIYIYDTGCRERALIETDFSYDSISFLDNHEVCMCSSDRCDIYTLSGNLKLSCEFEDGLVSVFHWRGYRGYIVLKEGVTERISLKVFGNLLQGIRSDDEQSWDDTMVITGSVDAETEEAEQAEAEQFEEEQVEEEQAEEEQAEEEQIEAEQAEAEQAEEEQVEEEQTEGEQAEEEREEETAEDTE